MERSGDLREKLLERLRRVDLNKTRFVVRDDLDLFSLLVAIILSQNTTEANSIRAFEKLKRETDLDPKKILEMGERLEETIRIAGLYRQKARSIRKIAETFLRVGPERISRMSWEELRRLLMGIKGIGKKTADLALLIYKGAPTFPVDTHIRRVTKRLGLSKTSEYDEVSKVLAEIFRPEEYLEVHRRLIALGRLYCKARNPQCSDCPMRDLCPRGGRSDGPRKSH